ncbi:MAG: Maf family protein [Steroidobacteraceae bacterium]
MPPLILASISTYRRELLSRLGLPFECAAPDVDETPLAAESHFDRAVRLALAKAAAVATRHPGSTVIGSDQVGVCKGEPLDKPGGAARARAQLQRLSAAAATFYTAVAVLQVERGSSLQFVDTTTVYFRALSDPEIDRYLAAERPFDCAGGFRCEGLGISLFSRVVSEDPTGLIGLPLIAVARSLRQLGYELP